MLRGLYTRDVRFPWFVLAKKDDFGLIAYDLVRPSSRFWADDNRNNEPVRLNVDSAETTPVATPVELLLNLPDGDNWQAMTRRSLGQIFSWFLVAEDRQRRLEARPIATLAHQASLVQHILESPNLQNVLIADEVGLGKTIEAGMLLKRLLQMDPDLRILYLAPARLVRNVRHEFERLGLRFRIWVAGGDRDARLTDRRIVASIHRACHPIHMKNFVDAPSWDVVVVDEAHHLSAWRLEGGDPTRRYELVDRIRHRMPNHGRLILMTGTPHQGHAWRFRNLLRLLQREGEDEEAVRGRVIYRTKDDVRDWAGAPLFPRRRVNPPLVLELPAEHEQWIDGIYEFFQPNSSPEQQQQARRRAMGWRCGQALQWATSSVLAGLGYLVRQGIRLGMDTRVAELRRALEAMRPYRNGPEDEPVDQLFHRIRQEIRQQCEIGDIADIESIVEDLGAAPAGGWVPDQGLLRRLMMQGVDLLRSDPDFKWRFIKERILDKAGDEKVVFFAQPIETVTALSRYLEQLTGQRPAIIVGGQSEDERASEIERFWREDGPRFLVSSRAGGEGINLQVARRLVHVDIPWNPMELEQRVGRVHRFMSRKTILVDTIVVRDSRETDMYEVARRKLDEITQTLALDHEHADALFSRVMALVPPEEIVTVLTQRPRGPLNAGERDRIAELVTEGFRAWRAFHEEYAERVRISELDPGAATWSDVASFARRYLNGVPAEGFSALAFRFADDEVVEESKAADVLEIGGELFAVGDYGGMPITDHRGRRASLLGLNVPVVVEKLRELAFPDKPSGAAYLGWPKEIPLPREAGALPFGVLAVVRQSVQSHDQWEELPGVALFVRLIPRDGEPLTLTSDRAGDVIRVLLDATIRRDRVDEPLLIEKMQRDLEHLYRTLCWPTEDDRRNRVRHAALPIFAAVVN